MAQNAPGLQPRQLEGEVEMKGTLMGQPVESTVNEQPSIDKSVESAPVSDNTEATVRQIEPNVEEQSQVEQPLTNRAEQRIQTLANEKAQAEAEKLYWQRLAQSMANVQQQQPVQSPEEMLAKQYKTFDASQGYPTDPKEYAHFVASNARLAAQQEAQRQTAQMRQQQDALDFTRAYPNAQNDPDFMGAVAARQAYAQRQGAYLSMKEAGDLVTKSFNDRASKRVIEDVANNDRMKDESYVESTRGASASSRSAGTKPDVSKMTLEEMEASMKADGSWDRI